jgi:hypothetical protein
MHFHGCYGGNIDDGGQMSPKLLIRHKITWSMAYKLSTDANAYLSNPSRHKLVQSNCVYVHVSLWQVGFPDICSNCVVPKQSLECALVDDGA